MNRVLIFAGGVGQRMHTENNIPKQFLKINDKPIIIYTLERFENCEDVDDIIVVCVDGWIKKLEKMIERFKLKKVSTVICGGKTGFESRLIGLEYLYNSSKNPQKDIVLIHDGVRPIVPNQLIKDNISMVKEKGCSVAASRAIETISVISEDKKKIEKTIDRNLCVFARAPQSFYLDRIYAVYKKAKEENNVDIIDSASLYSFYGNDVFLIETNQENIKITTPIDFYMFKGIISEMKKKDFKGEKLWK